MSDNSKIEWTDATWNPVTGCTKVSPGCDHCYAERVTEPFHGPGSFATVTLHTDRLDQPLRWRRPRKVFVNSMSDLFHDDVPAEFVAQVFAVMAIARDHTFQILTKRHGRMRAMVTAQGLRDRVKDIVVDRVGYPDADPILDPDWATGRSTGKSWWPLPNVWLGVSVETQQWADIRIPALIDTPAAVRFLSCEPLLGPVDLRWRVTVPRYESPIHWIIAGGESGPAARPMHPGWARSLRDQCQAARIPFLFKQWGEWAPSYQLRSERAIPPGPKVRDEHIIHTDHGVIRMHRVGKRAAGRELDGQTWDQYPDELVPA